MKGKRRWGARKRALDAFSTARSLEKQKRPREALWHYSRAAMLDYSLDASASWEAVKLARRTACENLNDLRLLEHHLRRACLAREYDSDSTGYDFVKSEILQQLAMLLCQTGRDAEARQILLPLGFRYRLAREVLCYDKINEPAGGANCSSSSGGCGGSGSKSGGSNNGGSGGSKRRSGNDDDRRYVRAVDDALPPELLHGMRIGLCADAPFWAAHGYIDPFNPPPYFSYALRLARDAGKRKPTKGGVGHSHDRSDGHAAGNAGSCVRGGMDTGVVGGNGFQRSAGKKRGSGAKNCSSRNDQTANPSPSKGLERVVLRLLKLAQEFFPAAARANYAEWWAHCRPHSSGHQMHFDSDNEGVGIVRNPICSCVLFVDGGCGGPTLVTDQTMAGPLARSGWLVHPKTNRVVVFDGSVLHGVVPGRGLSTDAQDSESSGGGSGGGGSGGGGSGGNGGSSDGGGGGGGGGGDGGGGGSGGGTGGGSGGGAGGGSNGGCGDGGGGGCSGGSGGVSRGGERRRVTFMCAFWEDLRLRPRRPGAPPGASMPLPRAAELAAGACGFDNTGHDWLRSLNTAIDECSYGPRSNGNGNGTGGGGGGSGSSDYGSGRSNYGYTGPKPVLPVTLRAVWQAVDNASGDTPPVEELREAPNYEECFQGF